jgi:hypothetical protein
MLHFFFFCRGLISLRRNVTDVGGEVLLEEGGTVRAGVLNLRTVDMFCAARIYFCNIVRLCRPATKKLPLKVQIKFNE